MSPGEKLFSNYISAVREFGDLRRHADRLERLMEEDEQARQIDLQHLPAKQAEVEELFADPFPQLLYASIVIANCILFEQHINGVAKPRSLRFREVLRWTTSVARSFSVFANIAPRCRSRPWLVGSRLGFSHGIIHAAEMSSDGAGQIESAQLRNFAAAQELPVFKDSVLIYHNDVVKILSRTWGIIGAMYAAAMRKFPSETRVQN